MRHVFCVACLQRYVSNEYYLSQSKANCTYEEFISLYIYIYTKILEVNLFAFAYRLFRRDFSPLDGTYVPSSGEKSLRNSL